MAVLSVGDGGYVSDEGRAVIRWRARTVELLAALAEAHSKSGGCTCSSASCPLDNPWASWAGSVS